MSKLTRLVTDIADHAFLSLQPLVVLCPNASAAKTIKTMSSRAFRQQYPESPLYDWSTLIKPGLSVPHVHYVMWGDMARLVDALYPALQTSRAGIVLFADCTQESTQCLLATQPEQNHVFRIITVKSDLFT
jgi:hypothetical protein